MRKERELIMVNMGFVHKCRILAYLQKNKVRFKDLETGKIHVWDYHRLMVNSYHE